jgi:hypothetical protein
VNADGEWNTSELDAESNMNVDFIWRGSMNEPGKIRLCGFELVHFSFI